MILYISLLNGNILILRQWTTITSLFFHGCWSNFSSLFIRYKLISSPAFLLCDWCLTMYWTMDEELIDIINTTCTFYTHFLSPIFLMWPTEVGMLHSMGSSLLHYSHGLTWIDDTHLKVSFVVWMVGYIECCDDIVNGFVCAHRFIAPIRAVDCARLSNHRDLSSYIYRPGI